MIAIGIIEEIISETSAKVRVPILDGDKVANFSVPNNNLNTAAYAFLPNSLPNYKVGDKVIVGFIDNQLTQPIILGALPKYVSKETKASISIGSLGVAYKTVLSEDTTIGKVKPEDIEKIAGLKGNIQGQLDTIANAVNSLDIDVVGSTLVISLPKQIKLSGGQL